MVVNYYSETEEEYIEVWCGVISSKNFINLNKGDTVCIEGEFYIYESKTFNLNRNQVSIYLTKN